VDANVQSKTRAQLPVARAQIESVLLYPGKTPDAVAPDTLVALRHQISNAPLDLQQFGLRPQPVFAVYAFNVESEAGPQWAIREHNVWVDDQSGKPIDHVINVLRELPDGYKSRSYAELINLLPPTYLLHRKDAETLQHLIAGKSRTDSNG
jgi:hypothetical protein